MSLPQFKANDETHVRLVELGQLCAGRVEAYIRENGLADGEYNVGRVRTDIRRQLLPIELREIDQLLSKLIGV